MEDTITSPLYLKKEHLSASSLVDFGRCPRRFFFRDGCRLRKPGGIPALLFGEAMHRGMPHAQRGELGLAVEAFGTIWNEELADRKRSLSRAESIYRSFIGSRKGSIYRIEAPPETDCGDRISPDEVPFAIDIGIDVPLVGRIDAVGRHRDTNELWGIEYKTTSELSTRFFAGFTFNPQVTIYTLALKSLSREPYIGVIIEGLQVAITMSKSLAFPVRVEHQALQDTVTWCQDCWKKIRECEESGIWVKNLSGCCPYAAFGMPGYLCDYVPLCMSNDWESLLGLFEVGDPKEFKIGKPEKETQNEAI